MTTAQDTKGALRAAFAQRELKNAKDSLSKGVPGLFVRAVLVTLFMNLVVISYLMMGTTGVVFVSLLFLLALLTPVFVHTGKTRWMTRAEATQQERPETKTEVRSAV